jgi:hypothetical protein
MPAGKVAEIGGQSVKQAADELAPVLVENESIGHTMTVPLVQ